jgi:hypothetical protein
VAGQVCERAVLRPGLLAGYVGSLVDRVVHDHEIVRRCVADLLENAGDMTVVGEAATASEARGVRFCQCARTWRYRS